MNQNLYHLEIWNIDGSGRLEMLRAGRTYSEALEALRTLVKALNWKTYGCGVYLMQNGLPQYEAKFVVEGGKRRELHT